MMKKQIFSLMLSTAIFTTNPLFAMETDQPEDREGRISCVNSSPKPSLPEGKGKAIPHIYIYTPSANPDFRFEKADEINGKGLLNIFPNEIIICFLKDFSIETILTHSTISKAMYNVCQEPSLWEHIGNKVTLKINPLLCIKDQVLADHAYYLNLFSICGYIENVPSKPLHLINLWDSLPSKQMAYEVRASRFKDFVKTPCDRSLWTSELKTNLATQSYHFSIGKRQFELYAINSYLTVEEALRQNEDRTFVGGHSGYAGDSEFFTSGVGAFYIKEIKPIVIKEIEKK